MGFRCTVTGMNGSLNRNLPFLSRWFERSNLLRALKVAIIIGTILTLINQGDQIWAGNTPPVWKVMLTYLVPYLVSSYAGAQATKGGQSR